MCTQPLSRLISLANTFDIWKPSVPVGYLFRAEDDTRTLSIQERVKEPFWPWKKLMFSYHICGSEYVKKAVGDESRTKSLGYSVSEYNTVRFHGPIGQCFKRVIEKYVNIEKEFTTNCSTVEKLEKILSDPDYIIPDERGYDGMGWIP